MGWLLRLTGRFLRLHGWLHEVAWGVAMPTMQRHTRLVLLHIIPPQTAATATHVLEVGLLPRSRQLRSRPRQCCLHVWRQLSVSCRRSAARCVAGAVRAALRRRLGDAAAGTAHFVVRGRTRALQRRERRERRRCCWFTHARACQAPSLRQLRVCRRVWTSIASGLVVLLDTVVLVCCPAVAFATFRQLKYQPLRVDCVTR